MVCLAAAFLCINYYSLDHHWLEPRLVYQAAPEEPGLVVRLAGVLGTILLPLAVLRRAITTRDRLLLWCGLVGLALVGPTVRAYVHLAPLWLLLILVGLAVLASRHLSDDTWSPGRPANAPASRPGRSVPPPTVGAGRGNSRHAGFLVTSSRAASTGGPGFKGEGGQFGGGGASESF